MRTKRAKWDNAGERSSRLCAVVGHLAHFSITQLLLAGDGTAQVAPKPEDLRQKAEQAAARIVAQIKEDKVEYRRFTARQFTSCCL